VLLVSVIIATVILLSHLLQDAAVAVKEAPLGLDAVCLQTLDQVRFKAWDRVDVSCMVRAVGGTRRRAQRA